MVSTRVSTRHDAAAVFGVLINYKNLTTVW
jgi:hypothetical protein